MEKICVIFGAGEYYGCERLPSESFSVVTADGGYAAAVKAGVAPEIHIGDFDSYSGPEITGCEIVRLRPEKDFSDTHNAALLAVEQGARELLFLGCTGGRTAHTVSNIQTMAYFAARGIRVRMIGNRETFACIHNGSIRFAAASTGYVSAFALTDECAGVTETGLKYEIAEHTLKNDLPQGLSNEFRGERAEISVRDGALLVIYGEGGIEE